MSHSPGVGKSGRTRGFDKPKKAKTRKVSNRQSTGPRRGVSEAQTLREVVDRTLAGLDNLGAQTFATPPFHQHYDRWLKSLITVLDDFEASSAVKADDRFHTDRGELLTAVDAVLKAEQVKEAERENKILGTRGSKDMLLQAEREHEARQRELSARRDEKLKELGSAVEALRSELAVLAEEKPGLLERFTKKKAQSEETLRARITSADGVLNDAKASFIEEAARVQSEYAERRRGILEIVAEERKEIEKLDAEAQVDGSVEVRRVACEELTEAVKDLVERLKAPGPS